MNAQAARSHANPVLDRIKSNRLFGTAEQNFVALQTFTRIDRTLAQAEASSGYPPYLNGGYDDGDSIGQSTSKEVSGRSAEMVIEDFNNGPKEYHPSTVANDNGPAEGKSFPQLSKAGRFKFNADGIICGYRLNKEPLAGDDIWVDRNHHKFPENVVTARDSWPKKGRFAPGKTRLGAVPDDAEPWEHRTFIGWAKARMSPEHFEAVYDATAGLGFGKIGEAAGFTGKQADAVGKDRVKAGLLSLSRLFAEWDDQDG